MNESDWIKHLKKLEALFRESFPNGTSKEFVKWVFTTYGYKYDDN